MKKFRFRLLALPLAACMILSACTADTAVSGLSSNPLPAVSVASTAVSETDEISQSQEESAGVSLPSEITPESEQTGTGKLRACSSDLYNQSANSFQTDRGFYTMAYTGDKVLQQLDEEGRAFFSTRCNVASYIDFNTRQQSVLCQKEGCTHSDYSCPVYTEGNVNFFEAGGKLILVKHFSGSRADGVLPDGTLTDEEFKHLGNGSITVMDMDGSNLRVILEDSLEDIGSQWFTDDIFLYGLKSIPVDTELPHTDTMRIFRINIETGEAEDLFDIPFEFFMYPTSTVDGKIVFIKMNYPKPMTEIKDDEWEQAMADASYNYVLLDPTSGEYEELSEGSNCMDNPVDYLGDDKYIFDRRSVENGDVSNSSIYSLDLRTMEETDLVVSEDNQDLATDILIDGKLFYSIWDTTRDTNGVPLIGTDKTQHKYLDLETGETHDHSLYLENDTAAGRIPLYPLADTGDYYLTYGNVSYNEDDTALMQNALILKDDYYAGNPNFIPITVV